MVLAVTLIVKAPNQQIEDQTVQCELSWTINKLKQHLSEVYPSKPPKHEQKLIYSGKLLGDSVILKDILRQYDGQDTHTVHLVCTPKYASRAERMHTDTEPTDLENVGGAHQADVATQNTPNATITDQRVPNMQWYQQFNEQTMQNMSNVNPQLMQMIMMQQAFMQAYYTQYQYMNMQQNNSNQDDQQPPTTTTAPPPPPPGQRNTIPAAGVAAAGVQPQPAVPAPPNNAANIARADEREMHRDWLDIFYMLSRSMIFISIVYFYSSPVRCVVVIGLALTLYLYQVGFFRNVNINNNNIVQGETAQEVQAPTRFMLLWTFFTTFFASLLPEIPNVV